MYANTDYIIGLINTVNPSAKVLDIVPYFKVYNVAADFVQESQYVYYGVFNVANAGSLTFSLFGSANIAITPADYAFTQPVLFNACAPAKAAFVGYRVKIA